MKKRLLSIMDFSNKKAGIAMILAAFVLAMTMTSGSVAAASANLSAAQAKEIALQKSGGGTVVKCKQDREDGIYVYEIEIINGDYEYSMDIGISNGRIYDFEIERINKRNPGTSTGQNPQPTPQPQITAQRAQEIALGRTGGGTVVKCKQDREDGRLVYEIEIVNGNISYELEVGASDGRIYNFEQEWIRSSWSNKYSRY